MFCGALKLNEQSETSDESFCICDSYSEKYSNNSLEFQNWSQHCLKLCSSLPKYSNLDLEELKGNVEFILGYVTQCYFSLLKSKRFCSFKSKKIEQKIIGKT